MELTPCRLSWGKVSSRGCFVGCAFSHGSGHCWNFVADAMSRCEVVNLITWEIRGTRPTSPTGDFGCLSFTRECANSPRMTPPPPIPCGGTSGTSCSGRIHRPRCCRSIVRRSPGSPSRTTTRRGASRSWWSRRESRRLDVATGTDGVVPFELLGTARIPDVGALDVWRLASYAGGIFLPMRDGLAGKPGGTYGGGRYLLDTVKGAYLGTAPGQRRGDSASFSTSISPTTRPAPTTRCGPVRCRKPATGSAPRCP